MNNTIEILVPFNGTAKTCSISSTSVKNVAWAFFLSISMLFSICGNLLVIISVTLSKVLREKVSSLFIVSLGKLSSDLKGASVGQSICVLKTNVSFEILIRLLCYGYFSFLYSVLPL